MVTLGHFLSLFRWHYKRDCENIDELAQFKADFTYWNKLGLTGLKTE